MLFWMAFPGEWNAKSQTDDNGDQKSKAGSFTVDHSGDSGKKHKYSFQLENPSDNIKNNRIIHDQTPLLLKNVCDITKSLMGSYDDHSITYLDGVMSAGDFYYTIMVEISNQKILAEIQL